MVRNRQIVLPVQPEICTSPVRRTEDTATYFPSSSAYVGCSAVNESLLRRPSRIPRSEHPVVFGVSPGRMSCLSYPHLDAVHSVESVCKSSRQHVSPSRSKSASEQRGQPRLFELPCRAAYSSGSQRLRRTSSQNGSVKSCVYIISLCLECALHHIRHHPRHYHVDYDIDALGSSRHVVRVSSIHRSRPDLVTAYMICYRFLQFLP